MIILFTEKYYLNMVIFGIEFEYHFISVTENVSVFFLSCEEVLYLEGILGPCLPQVNSCHYHNIPVYNGVGTRASE